MISIVSIFLKKKTNQNFIQIYYNNKLTSIAWYIAIYIFVCITQWLLVRRCDNIIRRKACLLQVCKNTK